MSTTFDLRNKVVVITGSSRGLGKEVAEAILRLGGKVLLVATEVETLANTCSEFEQKYGKEKVSFFQCDVAIQSNAEALMQQAVKRYDRLDVVINNAAIVKNSYDEMESCINVNLTAVIRITKLAVEYFKKNGGGLIVNVSSGAGFVPMADLDVYCATKAGMINFTKCMARNSSMTSSGIRFNVFCPWAFQARLVNATEGVEDVIAVIKHYEMMSIETVTEALMSLITDGTANGVILESSEKFGALRRDDIFNWPI